MKNFIIIFRMTNSCNLDCTYCYDKNNHISQQEENIQFYKNIPTIVDNICKLWPNKEDKSEIIFHGGEPLIINAKNYDILMNLIKSKYPNVRFSIQTNATLLNKEFIEVFKKYKVHIGISLDGYDELTNKCRIYKNKRNSFNDVMDRIQLLKLNHMRFGIIMTLTKNVIGKEKEIYEFLKDNNINCNIRPAFKCGENNIEFMTCDDYYNFFKNLFNIWIEDKSGEVKLMQIKEIYDEFAKGLNQSYNNKVCSSSGKCFMNFISLDCKGELYSCNRTYRNKEFYYGNISTISIEALKEKIENMVRNRQKYINHSKCIKCELYNECRGGCPANGYAIHKSVEGIDDNFCNAKIKIKKYVNKYLEQNGIKRDYVEMRKNDK